MFSHHRIARRILERSSLRLSIAGKSTIYCLTSLQRDFEKQHNSQQQLSIWSENDYYNRKSPLKPVTSLQRPSLMSQSVALEKFHYYTPFWGLGATLMEFVIILFILTG